MGGKIIVGTKRFQLIIEGVVPPQLEEDEVAVTAWLQGGVSCNIQVAGFVDNTHVLFKRGDITDAAKKM